MTPWFTMQAWLLGNADVWTAVAMIATAGTLGVFALTLGGWARERISNLFFFAWSISFCGFEGVRLLEANEMGPPALLASAGLALGGMSFLLFVAFAVRFSESPRATEYRRMMKRMVFYPGIGMVAVHWTLGWGEFPDSVRMAARFAISAFVLASAVIGSRMVFEASRMAETLTRRERLSLRSGALIYSLAALIDTSFQFFGVRSGEASSWLIPLVLLTQAYVIAVQHRRNLARLQVTSSELQARNLALDRALHAATAARDARARFVANVSHEIRTPLNGILGLSSLLTSTELNGAQREYVEAIRHSAQSLRGIVDDVLDFARIDEGRVEVRAVTFDPAEAIVQWMRALTPGAQAENLPLRLDLSQPLPQLVRGDRQLIRQILMNLVSNAIKFTERGGISVELLCEQGSLTMWVRDTGSGFREQDLPRLFAPFEQGDDSLTRQSGGIGLGLAITQRLVRALGGSIRANSAPSEGTTFRVEIPLEIVERWAPPGPLNVPIHLLGQRDDFLRTYGCYLDACGVTYREDGLSRAVVIYPFDGTAPPGAVRFTFGGRPVPGALPLPAHPNTLLNAIRGVSKAPERAPERTAQGRILVVEDNPVNQLVVCRLLRSFGYDVDTAMDGAEAVDRASEDWSAIIMDCQMPRLDGFAATRGIRAVRDDDLPIIGLTASALPETREKAMRSGMTDFLTKPVDPTALQKTVSKWVEDRESVEV